MTLRDTPDPQVLALLEELLENTDSLDSGSVTVDDGGDSVSIDTDEGPISISGSVSGDFEDPFGESITGTAFSVAENTTADVVTYNPTSEVGITGINGNGFADGRWRLYVNGNRKITRWTNQSEPNAEYYFDNPIEIESGDTAILEVENIGIGTADYEGAITIRL